MPDSNSNSNWLKYYKNLFNPKPQSQSLNYVNKLRLLRLRVFLRGFAVGFMLYPWVWVWGGWIILSALVTYLINTDYFVYVSYRRSIPFSIPGFAKGRGLEWLFLASLGLAFLINYTISFMSYRKNPALGVLMNILSFWLLIIAYFLVYILWQYNLSLNN